jgi:SAM-dependent methyltransferase
MKHVLTVRRASLAGGQQAVCSVASAAVRHAGRRWKDVLPLVAGLGLLVYVLSRSPLSSIVGAMGNVGPLFVLMPLVALAWNACNTSAFRVLLDSEVSWRVLYWNRLVGDGYNNLLPLGLGGEPFKLRHLSRQLPAERVAAALIRDRVIESAFGILITAACVAYAALYVPMPGALSAALWVFVAASAVLVPLSVALACSALPARLGVLVARMVGGGSPEAFEGLTAGRLLRVVAWLVPARLLGAAELAMLFSLLGIPVTVTNVVAAEGLLNAAGVVGFAIPGGIGVLEGSTVYLFGLLGHPGTLATAFALSLRGRLMLVSGFGVVLHMLSMSTARERPRAPGDWDDEYARGEWDGLDSTRELAHYAVIAGFVDELSERPRVLDVGCGHGRLYTMLHHDRLGSYLGIDVSVRAIERARRLAEDSAAFAVCDFDREAPEGPFDVIVFNESIYYAADAGRAFSRYLEALSDDGIVIVSIRSRLKRRRVRRAIHRVQRPAHSTTVTNEAGERWHVDVFTARARGGLRAAELRTRPPTRVLSAPAAR